MSNIPRSNRFQPRNDVTVLGLLMAAAGAFACTENPASPTRIEPAAHVAGNWVGGSRVVACDGLAVVCQQYPRGFVRYLAFVLTQDGQVVTGNLINTAPGPLVLPFPFPISGTTSSSDRFIFESVETAGVNVGYSGESIVTPSARMTGQMTERSTYLGDSFIIAWELMLVRQ